MPDYKKPYFQLFCIICDTIEELEQALLDRRGGGEGC